MLCMFFLFHQRSLSLTSFGNGKFPNELRHRNNADEHHQFNFERLVLKDLVFNNEYLKELILFYKLCILHHIVLCYFCFCLYFKHFAH